MCLPEVVHVSRDGVVGGQLHLEVRDDGGALLQTRQSHFNRLQPLHVVRRVRPDAVPLVQHLHTGEQGEKFKSFIGSTSAIISYLILSNLVSMQEEPEQPTGPMISKTSSS